MDLEAELTMYVTRAMNLLDAHTEHAGRTARGPENHPNAIVSLKFTIYGLKCTIAVKLQNGYK